MTEVLNGISKPKVPADESARLETLLGYELLDTAAEAAFDDLVKLASQVCGTPIGLVTLVAQERQWFKARVGLDATETPRDVAFCAHAINDTKTFVVEDVSKDARFAANPLVLGEPHIRFYAGVPLAAPNGQNLGTLCVIDRVPHTLSPAQEEALRILARQVMTQIELRKKMRMAENALHELEVAERALRVTDERFRDILDNMRGMVQSLDMEGRFLYVNRAWRQKLGYTEEEVATLPFSKVIHPDEMGRSKEIFERAVRGEVFKTLPGRLITKDGRSLTVEIDLAWRFENGKPVASRTIFHDVTEREEQKRKIDVYQKDLEEANKSLTFLAVTDELTGLRNRRAFQERLEEDFGLARRHKWPLGLLLMDVDKFKQFNDTFGHLAGDEVLKRVARALRDNVRATDFVCRFGGEEFAVLLPNTGLDGCILLAENLRKAVEESAWDLRSVTISIGVAGLWSACGDPTALIQHADTALYRAKAEGRNRSVASDAVPV
ncbi:MAG TPA: diguanylate cyclase [Candidatus Acidoferrales bacterium]